MTDGWGLILPALGGPTEEELLELLDQCDLALTRTPDSTPRASTCRSDRVITSINQKPSCCCCLVMSLPVSSAFTLSSATGPGPSAPTQQEHEEQSELWVLLRLSAAAYLGRLRPQ